MREGLMMDDYPLSLTGIVERAERLSPQRKVVFRRPNGSVGRSTFGDCAARARRLASALKQLGIEPGDPVATLMWNQPEHVEVYFTLPSMGAVLHTLNPRLHADELSFIVNDAEDRAIVVDESLMEVFESFRGARDFEHVIVVGRDGPVPDGYHDYEALIAGAEPMQWPEADERAAAAMCYTSGTTGRPKGVVYSHRALALHSLATALPDANDLSARDTVLPVVPMFHANAWGLIFTAALVGAGLVLPGPRLDAESILELLAAEQVTATAGVPTVWMMMLQALDAEPDRWDLSKLRMLLVGGSAVPRSMLVGFDRHGLTIVQAWGMTETSPVGSAGRLPVALDDAPADEQYDYRARQGVPLPFIEIRARGDDGELIAWDDQAMGELEVRGPWVARAYHQGQGAEKFSADGWFSTGDVVTIDATGNLKICDRSKDLVKSGGEWISSVDLENLLMAHEAVAEAAVIAIPDERWGERPLAVIVVHEEHAVEAEDLKAHLAQQYAKWQIPDRFEFIDEIPRTATGKFKKTTLREMYVDAKV
ncbi:MAG TPA: long-chain fatty acid--CoA ligase [Solirubrobacteraceae bacterium]|jgi:fatty-acyl-CoA synthase|nr:long-chain fatty acid--CoA ligase [Solirubrobacteraceae bacterium]